MTKALALDLAPHQITVNCVVPGTIETLRGLPGAPGAPGAPARRCRRSAGAASPRRSRPWCACCAARTRATSPASRSTSTAAASCREAERLAGDAAAERAISRRLAASRCRRRSSRKPSTTSSTPSPRWSRARACCPAAKAISFVKTLGGTKEACVIGSRIVTTAANAALANGMSAHADETDDSHAPSLTHPGCGIVPAALAMAERERRSGAALLRAVALGYDVGCRLTHVARRLRVPRGRPFDAQLRADVRRGGGGRRAARLEADAGAPPALLYRAAGVGHLVLDARRGAHREGVRLRRHAGAQRRRRGGDGRARLHRRGRRVRRASAASSSPTDATPKPEVLVRELGETYEIMRTNIKRWSVGSPIQAPLDSLLDLIKEHGVEGGRRRAAGGARRAPGREHHRQPQHAGHLHAAPVRGDAARRHGDASSRRTTRSACATRKVLAVRRKIEL